MPTCSEVFLQGALCASCHHSPRNSCASFTLRSIHHPAGPVLSVLQHTMHLVRRMLLLWFYQEQQQSIMWQFPVKQINKLTSGLSYSLPFHSPMQYLPLVNKLPMFLIQWAASLWGTELEVGEIKIIFSAKRAGSKSFFCRVWFISFCSYCIVFIPHSQALNLLAKASQQAMMLWF